jgi:Spy/CpxP family protein refolding chaperone
MKLTQLMMGAAIALLCAIAAAQPAGHDPIAENVFAPDLVMQHQQAVALTDGQKDLLKAEVRQAQLRLTELQWQLQDEIEKLAALLKQDIADEQRVMTQLDRVLNLERDIKRAHLGLVVRIKNNLTREQQAKLRDLRARPQGK